MFSASFACIEDCGAAEGLYFAPFQLAAQNLKIRFLWRLDELQQFFRAGNADKIRWLQRDTALAIEGQKNGLGVPGEGHLDKRGVADYKRSEEHTSELQSLTNLVCRLLLEKK